MNRLRDNVYYEFWSGLAAARLAVIEPMHRDDLLSFFRASWRALAKIAVPGYPATEIAAGESVFIEDVERRAAQIARDIAAAQGVSRVLH